MIKIFGVRKRFYIPILIALAFGYLTAILSPDVEVKYVYKVLPAFVVYTDNINIQNSGRTIALLVLIDKKLKSYEPTLTHELVHVRQGYRCLFTYPLMFPFDDTLLVRMECEAYATEIPNEFYVKSYAMFLKNDYKTSLTQKEIEEYLNYWVKQKT